MSATFNFGGGANAPGWQFSLGKNPFEADTSFNLPGGSNYGYAYQSLMNQMGVTNPSSNFYKFLQNYMPTTKSQFGVWQLDNPNGRVQDYFSQIAPQMGDQYQLLSPEDRGVNSRYAGTPRFLG